MFSLVKVSRLGRPIQAHVSIMVRNSSHFTYVADPPVENMGKINCVFSNLVMVCKTKLLKLFRRD